MITFRIILNFSLFQIFFCITTFSCLAQKTYKGAFKDVVVIEFQAPFTRIVIDYESDEVDLFISENCKFLGKKKKDVDPVKIVPSSIVDLEFELVNDERVVTSVFTSLDENGFVELEGLLEEVENNIAFIDGYKVKLAHNTIIQGDRRDRCNCKGLIAYSFTDKLIEPGLLFFEIEGKMNDQGIVEATKVEACRNTFNAVDYTLRKNVEQGFNFQGLNLVPKPPNVPFQVGMPLYGGNIQIGDYLYKLLNNNLLQAYVNYVGEELIPKHQKNLSPDDVNKISFRFYVIEDPIPNAFALPNGMIFIHTGILNLMENEAQLAIVLAHEIAHVTHEHGRERYESTDLSVFGSPSFTSLLIGRFSRGINFPNGLRDSIYKIYTALRPEVIADVFNPQPALESQADRVGLQYAYLAGYDIREGINFWNKIKRLTSEESFKEKLNNNFKNMLVSRNFTHSNPLNTLGDIGFNVLAKMFLETVYTSHPQSKVRTQALNQLIISGYRGDDFNGFKKGEAEFNKYVKLDVAGNNIFFIEQVKELGKKLEIAIKGNDFLNNFNQAKKLEELWQRIYPDLPNPHSCLIALAKARHNGDCDAARNFEDCFKLTYDSIKLHLALGIENQVLQQLQQLDKHFGAVLQVALENQNPCSKFAELAYDYALLTKGLILERGDVERNLINNSPNSILKESITKIKSFRRDDPVSDWNVLHTGMLSFNKALEHEIEKLDIVYPDLKHKLIRNYQWKDVLDQLHENEASVEYLLMPSKNGNAKDTNLLAVVLNKNNGVPNMVKLGRYNELKAIFFKNFETTKSLKPGASIFRGGETRTSDPVNSQTVVETPPDLSLYNLILEPLFNYLHGVNKVYYAPVDILNFIPFAAIPTPSGKYLGEFKTLEFRQVYSTRKVAQLFQENLARGRLNIHAFGNIDYGKYDESRWDSLPQTKLEVDFIGAFCKETKYHDAWLYQAKEASEEAFNTVCTQKKQSIVHLATHGFYRPDKNSKSLMGADPLERAGLIFAEANEYQPAKNSSHAANDGWLFASEISKKDLAQIHLAVLSACESGLGDIIQNEGVFGLPRAFLKAGAQTLLVSLWPVDDLEAKNFMVEFYKNYLPGNMSAFQALQKARATYWNDIKNRAKVQNWAGWVLLE